MEQHKVYTSPKPILFSQLVDGKFEKRWKAWSNRIIELRANATLVYKYSKDSPPPTKHILDVRSITLHYVPIDFSKLGVDVGSGVDNEIGLHCECAEEGFYSAFKAVLPKSEVKRLCLALLRVAEEHNIDEFLADPNVDLRIAQSDRDDVESAGGKSNGARAAAAAAGAGAATAGAGGAQTYSPHAHSVMRRSIARALDKNVKRTRIEKIIARRGAFRSLPVAFTNDLVHGSWWYVIGSLFTVIFPVFVIAGNYDSNLKDLSYDDDVLGQAAYDSTWILMMVSGFFFTVGSWAFLRAVNDPPMRPFLHRTYHFGTDELLGSWCFVGATVPFLPYALIYLAADPGSYLMYCLVAASLFAILGSLIFLANCYPSDDDRPMYVLPLLLWFNCGHCCCSEETIAKHLVNDWLAGTWIILIVTAFGTFVCFLTFIYAMAEGDGLSLFVNGCTFADCVLFLIGSVYFVAGSYPEAPASMGSKLLPEGGDADNTRKGAATSPAGADVAAAKNPMVASPAAATATINRRPTVTREQSQQYRNTEPPPARAAKAGEEDDDADDETVVSTAAAAAAASDGVGTAGGKDRGRSSTGSSSVEMK